MKLADYLDNLFCWRCGQGGEANFDAKEVIAPDFSGYRIICQRCGRRFHVAAKTVVLGVFKSLDEIKAERCQATIAQAVANSSFPASPASP